ncbi:MAG: hypothetical protein IPH07_24640 [Deltaproteobacteria bacterium]|nr:hypothetical protein [Deltaproteobacteria bacterium]
MPQLPIAIATAAGASAATLATVSAVSYGVAIAYSIVEANRMARRKRAALDASYVDRKIAIRSTDQPRNFIYGTVRLAPRQVAHWFVHGEFDHYWSARLTFADRKVTAIDEVYLDGEPCGTLDGSGFVQAGSRFYKTRVVPQVATFAGVAADDLLAVTGTDRVIDTVAEQTADGGTSVLVEGQHYTIEAGGVRAALAIAGTVVVSYRVTEGKALVRVRKFLGEVAGERDTTMESESAGLGDDEWTSADVLAGQAGISIRIEADQDIFPNGLPAVEALVRGHAVYDPRTETSAHSNNAILCIADFIASDYGWSADYETDFDLDDLIAEANLADELVDMGSLADDQARYTIDGIVYAPQERGDQVKVLQQMLTSCLGTAVVQGGVWRVRGAAYRAPALSLTDADVAQAGDIETQPYGTLADTFNSVRGRFVSASADYEDDDFEPVSIAAYVTEDGRQIWRDIDLPYVVDPLRAQRLARLYCHLARQALKDTAVYQMTAWPVEPTDTVDLTRTLWGFDAKVLQVLERRFDPVAQTVTLVAKEEAEAVYEDDYEALVGVDPAPNTTLPDPSVVAPVAELELTSDDTTFALAADGTVRPYAILAWDAVEDSGVLEGGSLHVHWKTAGETEYRRIVVAPAETSVHLEPVSRGDVLNVYVVAMNGAQVASTPTFATHTVSSLVPVGGSQVRHGGNQIQNADAEWGVEDWQVDRDGLATNDVRYYLSDGNGLIGMLVGSPKVSTLAITGTGTVGGVARYPGVIAPKRVSIDAEQWVSMGARVRSNACRARLRARFFGGGDALISEHVSEYSPVTSYNPADDYDVSGYTQLSLIAQAPAGATSVEYSVRGTGPTTGALAGVSIYKPQLDVHAARPPELPPWTIGYAARTPLAVMASGGSVRLDSASQASSTIEVHGSAGPSTLWEMVETAGVTITRFATRVTVRGSLRVLFNTTAGLGTVEVWLVATIGGATSTGVRRAYTGYYPASSGSNYGSVAIEDEWTVQPGAGFVVTLMAMKTGDAVISASRASLIVEGTKA